MPRRNRDIVPQSTEETRAEIQHDIEVARQAQREAAGHGQYRISEEMRQAADDHLDELAELDAGTWKPRP
ncbi:hypothetical protein [Streptomyces sp. NPDC002526]